MKPEILFVEDIWPYWCRGKSMTHEKYMENFLDVRKLQAVLETLVG